MKVQAWDFTKSEHVKEMANEKNLHKLMLSNDQNQLDNDVLK